MIFFNFLGSSTQIKGGQNMVSTKATNKTIVNGLKKRIGAKGKWAEELPNVLWAYRTALRRSTGETPFLMTFGTEVVITVEINLSSYRITRFSLSTNDVALAGQLEFIEENKERVSIKLANYQ